MVKVKLETETVKTKMIPSNKKLKKAKMTTSKQVNLSSERASPPNKCWQLYLARRRLARERQAAEYDDLPDHRPTCCLCRKKCRDNLGYNANPVMDNICCEKCNYETVIPARIAKFPNWSTLEDELGDYLESKRRGFN